MGGCLSREKEEKENLIKNQNINDLNEIKIIEFHDITEINKIKNREIVQITQFQNKNIMLIKMKGETNNLKMIEINGDANSIYLEVHKQLQQSENYFIGSLTFNDKCILIVKPISGLAAQVSIQEIQCLDSVEKCDKIIQQRHQEKFQCVGVVYIQDLIILVFRQFYFKTNKPFLKKYETIDNNTLCLLRINDEIFEIKRQL